MSISTITTTRSRRTQRTGQALRTVFTAFAKPLQVVPELPTIYAPTLAAERPLTVEEEKLVTQIVGTLSPTVLHPFKDFKRPWPLQAGNGFESCGESLVGQAMQQQNRERDKTHSLADTLQSTIVAFIDKIPELLSFRTETIPPTVDNALIESLKLRMTGNGYQAACMLHALASDAKTANVVRLHHNDTLTGLRIYSHSLHSHPVSSHASPHLDAVTAALSLQAYRNHLFERLTPAPGWDVVLSAVATTVMFRAPVQTDSWNDLYAKILYAHTIIVSARFAQVYGDPTRDCIERLSTPAVEWLLELWHAINERWSVDHADFLRWRLGQALNECLPFSSQSLLLPDRQDLFAGLADTKATTSSEALVVLRSWWNGGPIDDEHHSVLKDYVEDLVGRRDIGGLDDFLQALQLIDNAHLAPLRMALRRESWRLHRELLPAAPCVLDDGVQQPLYLWVAQREKSGHLAVRTGLNEEDKYPGAGNRLGRWKQIQHLQFGFGKIQNREHGAKKWVYSWSILFHCLQYTPSPFNDPLYSLLFIDSDLFSWSQSCHRLRLICRTFLSGAIDTQDLLLDGCDALHAALAGCGEPTITADGHVMLVKLAAQIQGLSTLRQELQIVEKEVAHSSQAKITTKKTRSNGLSHLAGLCLVWRGLARFEYATQMSDLLSEDSDSSGTRSDSDDPLETRDVLSVMVSAREELHQALQEGRKLTLASIKRQAGDGLLRIHDTLFDLAPHDDQKNHEVAKALSRLELCRSLQKDMSAAVLQLLSTEAYRFRLGPQSIVTTVSPRASAGLYQCGQKSSYSLGRNKEACLWLQRESDAMTRGHAMAVLHPERERRFLNSCDPHIPMAEMADSLPEWCREFIENTTLENAAMPIEGMLEPSSDIDDLIKMKSGLWEPAKIIQFGRYSDEELVVYATDLQGQVRAQRCAITSDSLSTTLTIFQRTVAINAETVTAMTELNPLATAIAQLTVPDELIVFVPGSVCRGVPLHALEVEREWDMTLSERNPITYASSPFLVRQCMLKSLDNHSTTARQRRTTAAAVFKHPDKTVSDRIEETAAYIAQTLGGRLLVREQVTFDSFEKALEESEWMFFLGHGGGGLGSDGKLTLPAIALQADEVFSQYDLAATTLPESCIVFIACESGKVREWRDDELESLAITALMSGALATVGTMFEVFTQPGRQMARCLARELRPAPKGQASDNTSFNLARATQRAVNKMRDKLGWGVEQWGPFAVNGAPVVIIGRRSTRSSS